MQSKSIVAIIIVILLIGSGLAVNSLFFSNKNKSVEKLGYEIGNTMKLSIEKVISSSEVEFSLALGFKPESAIFVYEINETLQPHMIKVLHYNENKALPQVLYFNVSNLKYPNTYKFFAKAIPSPDLLSSEETTPTQSNTVQYSPESEVSPPNAPHLNFKQGNKYILLTWYDSLSSGASPIAYFLVYRANGINNYNYTEIANVSAMKYNDTNVIVGDYYNYYVIAVNEAGKKSTASNLVTVEAKSIPSAPRNLVVADKENNFIAIKWDTPSDTGGGVIAYYIYKRLGTSGNFYFYKSVFAPNTTFVDTHVSEDETYYYYVIAVNEVGKSNPSNTVNAVAKTVLKSPYAPQQLFYTYNPDDNTTLKLTLHWYAPKEDKDSVTEYKIYKGTSFDDIKYYAEVKVTNIYVTKYSYADGNVKVGGTYFYYITAVRSTNESKPSNTILVKYIVKPAPPTNLKIYLHSNLLDGVTYEYMIKLEWSAPTYTGGQSIEGYKVYYRTNLNDSWQRVSPYAGTIDTSKTSMTYVQASGLVTNKTYYFEVVSYNGKYTSPTGVTSSIKIKPSIPPVEFSTDIFFNNVIRLEININYFIYFIKDFYITEIQIYKGTSSDNLQLYDVINTKISLCNGMLKYLFDPHYVAGTTYYYQIKLITNANSYKESQIMKVKINSQNIPAPHLKVIQYNSTLKLEYTENYSGFTNKPYYVIFRNTNNDTKIFRYEYVTTPNLHTYIDSHVKFNRTYSYFVLEYEYLGGGKYATSNPSNIVTLTLREMFAFEPVYDIRNTTSYNQIKLNWKWNGTIINTTQFEIYRSTDGKNFTLVGVTNVPLYIDKNVKADTQYYYYIVVRDTTNEAISEPSTITKVITAGQPQEEHIIPVKSNTIPIGLIAMSGVMTIGIIGVVIYLLERRKHEIGETYYKKIKL